MVLLLTVVCVSNAYRHLPHQRQQIISKYSDTRLYSDKSGDTGDALSRRRKRRGKDEVTVKETAKSEVSGFTAQIH